MITFWQEKKNVRKNRRKKKMQFDSHPKDRRPGLRLSEYQYVTFKI